MKRLILLALALIMVFNIVSVPSFAADGYDIIINGTRPSFSNNVIIEKMGTQNFQLLAPANELVKILGGEVNWYTENEELLISKKDKSALFRIGSTDAIQNGVDATLQTPARIVNGVVYIPVEFSGDSLGYHALRENSGLRVRLVSRTMDTAPAIEAKGIKPGTAELKSTYHRKGIPVRFTKSNDLNDLIYNRTDYSKAVKIFQRRGPVAGGEVVMSTDKFNELVSQKDSWWDKFRRTEIVNIEQDEKISVDVFMNGDSIGRTYKEKEFLPFNKALEINVTIPRYYQYDKVMNFPTFTWDCVKEDSYLISFYARRISGGEEEAESSKIEFCFIGGGGTGFEKNIEFGNEWQKFEFLYTGGTGTKYLRLCPAVYKQKIQIGAFEIRNLGPDVDTSYYKTNKIDKVAADLEPDAPWRKEAIERIEKVRKGDFTVKVQDKNGNPVEDAQVIFNMFEHEFKFGTTMDIEYINGMPGEMTPIDPIRFTQNLEKNFNSMSVGNGLKWACYDQEPDRAQNVIDVAFANGIKYVRGHALWMPAVGGDARYPTELYDLVNDPRPVEEKYVDFKQIIRNHFRDMNNKFPYIYEWDVTNELLGRTTHMDMFGERRFLMDMYQIAAEELTNGQELMLCDNRQYVPSYWDFLDRCKEYGFKYDSLGMQGHSAIGSQAAGEGREASISEVMEIWDRFAYEYGKTFAVTEFSLGAIKDEYGWDGQGDYLRDYLIAIFSHPAATGFNIWWLYDHYMSWNTIFNPRDAAYGKVGAGVSPLYGEWFIEKPGVAQYQDLLYNKWWTRNEKATTDATGAGTIRGFYGDYDVVVKVGGKTVKTDMVAFRRGYENVYTITLD